MGVEERGSSSSCIHKDAYPFAGMVMVEVMLVGGNTLFKSASDGINSFVFTFYVFFLGFIFLFPAIILLHRSTSLPPIKMSFAGKVAILSVLMYSSQVIGYIGIKYGSPTLSSMMSNLSPAFTFVLAFLFRMEKVHLRRYTTQAKIIGTMLSISGAIIATLYSGPSLLSTSSMNMNWIIGGILLASQHFLVSFCMVAQAKILVEYSVDLVVVFLFATSGMFAAAIGALVMARDLEAWKLKFDIVSASVLYSGFFSGAFNVLIQVWVLRVKGPVYLAMFKPLTIIIAVIMGVLILDDSLYLGSVLGGIIITIGFYAVIWGKAKEDREDTLLLDQATIAPLLRPHNGLEEA